MTFKRRKLFHVFLLATITSAELRLTPNDCQTDEYFLIDKGINYQGRFPSTFYGDFCQNWTEDYPVNITREIENIKKNPRIFTNNMRETMVKQNLLVGKTWKRPDHNFCANPGGLKKMPWCFKSERRAKFSPNDPRKNQNWEYCAPTTTTPVNSCHKCPDSMINDGKNICVPDPGKIIDCPEGYHLKRKTTTKLGEPCQNWSVDQPHKVDVNLFENKNLVRPNTNQCLNPDKDGKGPWCYLRDGPKRVTKRNIITNFEYCYENLSITELCELNHCKCENGIANFGQDCHSDGDHSCESCHLGYYLNDKTGLCDKILECTDNPSEIAIVVDPSLSPSKYNKAIRNLLHDWQSIYAFNEESKVALYVAGKILKRQGFESNKVVEWLNQYDQDYLFDHPYAFDFNNGPRTFLDHVTWESWLPESLQSDADKTKYAIDLDQSLKSIIHKGFSEEAGANDRFSNFLNREIILIVDDYSTLKPATIEYAALHDIMLHVVMTRRNKDQSNQGPERLPYNLILRSFSNRLDGLTHGHFYQAEEDFSLTSAADRHTLLKNTCLTVPPMKEVCHSKADIGILVDGSNSISQTGYNKEITFLQELFRIIDLGHGKIHTGVLQFAGKTDLFEDGEPGISQPAFWPLKGRNRKEIGGLLTQLSDNYLAGTSTYVGNAVNYLYEMLYENRRGDDTKAIAIILTDGASMDDLALAGERLNSLKHLTTFVIGIGPETNLDAVKDHLLSIALPDPNQNFMHVRRAGNLQELKQVITGFICNAGSVGFDVSAQTSLYKNDPSSPPFVPIDPIFLAKESTLKPLHSCPAITDYLESPNFDASKWNSQKILLITDYSGINKIPSYIYEFNSYFMAEMFSEYSTVGLFNAYSNNKNKGNQLIVNGKKVEFNYSRNLAKVLINVDENKCKSAANPQKFCGLGVNHYGRYQRPPSKNTIFNWINDADAVIFLTTSRMGRNSILSQEYYSHLYRNNKKFLVLYSKEADPVRPSDLDWEYRKHIVTGFMHNRFDLPRRREIQNQVLDFICELSVEANAKYLFEEIN